ncbi:MAG: SMP-30/gluconolactonase/LRE family protein [Pseudomonadota bacterium]
MTFKTLVTGLSFGEGPRWRDGHLYYSDFYRHVVERVDVEGNVEQVAHVPNQPSGLGWLPDGRLLIVSMLDRKLLRLESNGELSEHASLESVAAWHCNDMVVDTFGRAYVGNFGFDRAQSKPKAADLACVDPDGTVSCAAGGFKFPNGSVITPDGETLVVGETMGKQLTAFDIGPDGSLSNRRVWADLGEHYPDGICLDEAGGIWVTDPVGAVVVRVEEGGNITDTLDPGRSVFACMLGGADRKRLFICTASTSGPEVVDLRDGKIEYADVDISGAGLP